MSTGRVLGSELPSGDGVGLSAAALFTLLWEELADVLGTAATAVLVRRAARRGAPPTAVPSSPSSPSPGRTWNTASSFRAPGPNGPTPPPRPAAAGGADRPRRRPSPREDSRASDDDAEIRDALKFLLEHYGAEVAAAGSAAEALVALERSMPDVLLSDVSLRGESGYDLMRKVTAREGGRALPAAALSRFSREQDRERALAAGFRIHLEKPIEPEALIAAVARLAGRMAKKDSAAARRP